MNPTKRIRKLTLGATALGGLALGAAMPALAADSGPIKIGVIGEASSVAGASIINAAKLAADDINQAGGIDGRKVEIITYDDHSSASDAVSAFKRLATQDKVAAVVGSYISEIALAIEPWSGRLHMPYITPGAASTKITAAVHKNYKMNKYTFQGWLNSAFLAQSVCDFGKDEMVGPYHMKTAVIMSEDAAWTKPLDETYKKCLPKVGLKVLDEIRFNPDTTDFTPIFNKIEGQHPDVIVTGISHVGVRPTVQWHDQQVPLPMFGISSQASTSTFWKDTNGAAEGVLTQTGAAPDVATTPKTMPFAKAYQAKFGDSPSYVGYAAYDDVNAFAQAIKRAGSTDPDKIVAEMEKTKMVGTTGTVQFYGKDNQYAHGLEYGKGKVTGLFIQWQSGKQVTVWPEDVANGKMKFPSFVKLTAATH
ncbi:ABC transporter substrate-binding protein [Acidimangrovimonas sediminis]|uniref:ABC transporter substrate-binding protein n=1 Tax=Acidimangrovimonas sediminis TaxID=2056283 RepID=UPI000C7F864C|nr:ABC transporter substrate-binding protein [Acidimangrovimonas sediminis]